MKFSIDELDQLRFRVTETSVHYHSKHVVAEPIVFRSRLHNFAGNKSTRFGSKCLAGKAIDEEEDIESGDATITIVVERPEVQQSAHLRLSQTVLGFTDV